MGSVGVDAVLTLSLIASPPDNNLLGLPKYARFAKKCYYILAILVIE